FAPLIFQGLHIKQPARWFFARLRLCLRGFGTLAPPTATPSVQHGGEVTTASTLLSGNCRMTSRHSSSYNVHSAMRRLLPGIKKPTARRRWVALPARREGESWSLPQGRALSGATTLPGTTIPRKKL